MTNSLTSGEISLTDALVQLIPTKAIVVFSETGTGDATNYVEVSDIDKNGKALGFSPLRLNDLKSILAKVTAAENGLVECTDIMPGNLLFANVLLSDFKLIWYEPQSIKTLKFQKKLNMPDCTIKVPALIYVATRKGLQVFALKRSVRPTAKTELYSAPFFNLSQDGRVCLGNVKTNIPVSTNYNEIMEIYMRSFWYSYFTDSGSTNTIAIWRRLIKTKAKVYPTELLKKNMTVKTFKSLLK